MAEEIFDPTTRILTDRMQTQYEQVSGNLPVQYDGVAFTPPGDGKYVRFTIRFASGTQKTIGKVRTEQQSGAIIVNIFGKIGEGDTVLLKIADKIAKVFRYWYVRQSGVALDVKAPEMLMMNQAEYLNYTLTFEFDARVQITVPYP